MLNLYEAGIFLPYSMSNWSGSPDLAWACSMEKKPWADVTVSDPKKIIESWCISASENDCNTVLVSSEELCRLDLEAESFTYLVDALQPYEVSVIGYTRDIRSFLISRYRHEIQNGSETRPVGNFLKDPSELLTGNFSYRTSIWKSAFRDRVHIFDYDKSLKNGDIISHFYSVIGLADLRILSRKDNTSEIKIHPSLLDLRRYITIRIGTEFTKSLSDRLYDLSRSMDEICGTKISIKKIIRYNNISLLGNKYSPSIYPVASDLEAANASKQDMVRIINEFLNIYEEVDYSALSNNQDCLNNFYEHCIESEIDALIGF
jgi:hypothetical protein